MSNTTSEGSTPASQHSSPASTSSRQHLPMPNVSRKPKRNLAWVWLIPILSALIGVSLVYHAWSQKGPTITISFKSAAGLEVGKTQIKYRDVVVGLVKDIRLSDQRDKVIVDAELSKDAQGLAHTGTKFWVVKPRVGAGGISGLSTLISGSYIEADTDNPVNQKVNQREFVGLETPPPIQSDRPGTRFTLQSTNMGSLGTGSPVYFRRIQVGSVTDYRLHEDGKFVDIQVFIDSPYDKYVTMSTRFWDASGVTVNLGSGGVEVHTESLAAILAGGVAFDSFGSQSIQPAQDYRYRLYASQKAAEAVPRGIAVPIWMRFNQNTRGLTKGALIDFKGTEIGIVEDVQVDVDRQQMRFFTSVQATLYPERLNQIFSNMPTENRNSEHVAQSLGWMIQRGMRAQLRTANLLTGQLYIALDEFPKAPKIATVKTDLPLEIPTVTADDLGKIQEQVANIVAKIDKMPFEEIGKELNSALKQLSRFTASLDQSVVPELNATMKQLRKSLSDFDALIEPGSPMNNQFDSLVQELTKTSRSLRQLTESIQSQPNSVIMGRKGEPYSRENIGAPRP